MKHLTAHIAGAERSIAIIENSRDAWISAQDIIRESLLGPISLDTETTGFDIYGDDYRVRTIQFGTKKEAWVFPMESAQGIKDAAETVLEDVKNFVAQNMSFDIRSLEQTGHAAKGDLWEKTADTYIMAHLLDPRERSDGGTGHSLEELSAEYFDPDALQFKDALFDRFKELGYRKKDGWGIAYAGISIEDETYLRYAGVDVLLTSWLFDALRPLIVARGFTTLSAYEHKLAEICGGIMDRGMAIDASYMIGVSLELDQISEEASRTAAAYGVENVNSTKKVGDALEALGAPLTAKTKTGWKVDKEVLEGLVASEGPWSPLAAAVMTAKNSKGFRTKYVEKVLDSLDGQGRVHANLRPLKARTARMSVSEPPLQQLPSGDWKIRRGFVARPGYVIVACDLDQVELRVLAAVSQEPAMTAAIQRGDDLHQVTADGAGVSRKVGKMANFLVVYGGGAAKLAVQAGIPLAEAQKALTGYHRTFPGVKRYSRKIQERCEMGLRDVVTPTGRHLPMDRSRSYAGLNYQVQSTARDVLGQALIEMEEAGVAQWLIMLVHDEAIAEVPEHLAEEVARKMGEAMTMKNFLGSGIDLTAEAEIYGASWGHGYGAPS